MLLDAPADDRHASSSGPSPTPSARCATTRPTKPGVSNLLDILAAATGTHAAGRRRRLHPVRAAQDRHRRGRDRGCCGPIQARYRELIDDQAELARLLRRSAPTRPATSPRRRSSGPTTPSACSRALTSGSRDPTDRPDHLAGHPGAREPRRRAALRARRHGDRRPARHRPARRAGARRHGALVRGRRLQLPDLRHDRAGRPPPRRRRRGRRRRRRRPGDLAAVLVGVPLAPVLCARRARCRPLLGASGEVLDYAATYLRDQRRRRAVRHGHARRPGRAARRVRLPHAARGSCSAPTSSTPCSRSCSCSGSTWAWPARPGRP